MLDETNRRLQAWAAAFGGEQFRRFGYVESERLKGPPDAAEPMDSPEGEIERIVRAMEQGGRWRESRVLRCEYFCAGLPERERMMKLRRLDVSVSRASYYTYLSSAFAYVEGALSLRQPKNL
jgi:hypothetical protein